MKSEISINKKLSLILVSSVYPDENGRTRGGGISTVYYELAHGLVDLGHEVFVITHSDIENKEYMDGKVHVCQIKSYEKIDEFKKKDQYRDYTRGTIKALCRSNAIMDKIELLLNKKTFDIVQFPELDAKGYHFIKFKNNPNCPEKFKNIKSVVRLHSSTKPYRRINNRLSKKGYEIMNLEKYTIENCDLVISPCLATVKAVKKAMNIDEFPVAYIPNSIDSNFFKPNKKEKKEDRFLFGYVGTISKSKGSHTLLKAFANIASFNENVELMLIGKEAFTKKEKCYYSELFTADLPNSIRKRITIIHLIPRKELVSYYQRFDAFVFPSLHENFPNALMEAMSCGLPILTTSVGGIPELLGEQNPSLRLEPGDVEGLAKGMLRMFNDTKFREESGKFNRKRIKTTYTNERILNECYEAYKNLLLNKK